ncbi:uncharacterized protein Z518_02567 [Rhinocladiella mackenziei CBS 650.93]|uniref:ABM domain-containing protein n=1 Tax=Rhinocladiella mackenziei CBS 650.93 TaxID=1442369 RepID=A0A0D2HBU1_9EURO|nr:uncharacterized protein Z518_02567 [Rhinocladiella mackenziei CBS 650.93]KIX07913.1 hypothetical protein Z518_02567 [Rhinocladiella mackenziei CBS 650.93]
MAMVPSLGSTYTTLHVTIQVDPSNVEPFLAALRPCWAACIREPECILFDVFHSGAEPGTFRFTEVWTKDEKWFREHQLTKPYYEPYLAITQPMWVADRKMEFFERIGGWCYIDEAYSVGSVNP